MFVAYTEMGIVLKEKAEFILSAEHYEQALMEQYHHDEVFRAEKSRKIPKASYGKS